jgi:cytochrome c-type biogenesis protein CcmH/NrfG
MENEQRTGPVVEAVLEAKRVYALALLCLAAGLGIGYVLHSAGPATQPEAAAPAAKAAMPASPHGSAANGHMPTGDEMKQMADKKAAPLKLKLKSDAKNAELLAQVGAIYHSVNQFSEAAGYYSEAVQAEPKNPALRIKLASSLFRSGDADGAIGQLNECLKIDPSNANALFDLGVIRLEGKQDAKGAAAAWRQLLKSNPDLIPERKAAVEKMLAQASANASRTSANAPRTSADAPRTSADAPKKGAESHDGAK